jgi:hypothetical protein
MPASRAPRRPKAESHQVRFRGRPHPLAHTARAPIPIINTKVNGHEVDALCPEQKLILELDSWPFHKDYPTWRSDRERDGENLASGGYRTFRIPEHLTDTKAEQLAAMLDA